MHISEGVLSGPVLVSGAALAAAGIGQGIRRMSVENTPKTAMMSAVFFVSSLVHVPFGPSNVHLLLNGLAGILLGWAVFPALAVALFLQALMFQFGGLTVLGVNTLNLALPGLLAHFGFGVARRACRRPAVLFAATAVLCAVTVLLSGVLLTVGLTLSGKVFLRVAAVIVAGHIPVMLADGLVSGAAVLFFLKVRPDLLESAEGSRAA